MRRTNRLCLIALLGAGLSGQLPADTHAAPAALTAAVPAAAAPVRWLRVDPLSPNTLYVGVSGPFFKRSTDGGATWGFQRDGTVLGTYAQNCGDAADAPIISGDSHDLYVIYNVSTDAACRAGSSGMLRSRDGGLGYQSLRDNASIALATPVVSRRLYAVLTEPSGNYLSPAQCSQDVYSRDPGDTAWRKRGVLPFDSNRGGLNTANTLSADTYCPDLIDDPQSPSLLYANTLPPARSEDAGVTWTAVVTPTETPTLTTFALRPEPAAPGMLEGFTTTQGVPKDRVYLSADHGLTWTATTCPGGRNGACPRSVVRGLFGGSSSYAIYQDGVYAFNGTGPAGTRLPLGAGWPFTLAQVAYFDGGTRAGGRIYALTQKGRPYASTDAGHSWKLLANAAALPTAKLKTTPPGALRAGPYGYAVDPHFIPTYRRLGSAIVGFPVDAPYQFQGRPTQDFEHLALAWDGGRAVVTNLAQESAMYIYCGMGSDNPLGFCANSPRGTSGSASQKHAAEFAAFMAHHGGTAVFGVPLSGVYQAKNDDHSGRTYQMRLFSKARLEWHPENKNPKYRILLGLLGPEVLRDRHWD